MRPPRKDRLIEAEVREDPLRVLAYGHIGVAHGKHEPPACNRTAMSSNPPMSLGFPAPTPRATQSRLSTLKACVIMNAPHPVVSIPRTPLKTRLRHGVSRT